MTQKKCFEFILQFPFCIFVIWSLSFDLAQDGELTEPFEICYLKFAIYLYKYLFCVNSGALLSKMVKGGTDSVSQTLPPIMECSPTTVLPPKIVAPE